MNLLDIFIVVAAVSSLVFSWSLGLLDKNLVTRITAIFGFVILAQYQNCSNVDPGGFKLGSTGQCSAGQYVDIQGNCGKNNSSLKITIDSSISNSPVGLQSTFTGSGTCSPQNNSQVQLQLVDSSTRQTVNSVSDMCQRSGIYSITFLASYGNQVVPSAGSYKLVAIATLGSATNQTSISVVFSAGPTTPTITGPGSLTTLPNGIASILAAEQAYLPPNGGPANLQGSCNTGDTQFIELHHKGLGPVSDQVNDYAAPSNNCQGSYTLYDPIVAAAANGYGNYIYQVVATDVYGVKVSSQKVAMFVRALPKDINSDDILLIEKAIARNFNMESRWTPAAGDSIGQQLLSNPSFGIFQAACAAVSAYSVSVPVDDPTRIVCNTFDIPGSVADCINQYNSNLESQQYFWTLVLKNLGSTPYLIPQKTAADQTGTPLRAIPATICP